MRRLNKVTALVIAGVISCTSPMMVMASDSGSVMSQAEEILKDNEVGSLASDPDKVGDIIVYVKGLFVLTRSRMMRFLRGSMRLRIILG